MKNFWQELPKPFFVLAPLADVTDAPFRRLIAKYSKYDGGLPYTEGGLARSQFYASDDLLKSPVEKQGFSTTQKTVGGPDVMYTEFVSADGLVRATPEGKAKLMADLIYSEGERPIVVQLFSSVPEYMETAAALCRELGFDGVDINMGCPDRSVEKQGCGAAMIKHPEQAVAVIEAAKRGARHDKEDGIPVSVKTRLGYNQDELEEWLSALLSAAPAAVTIHARTRQEMSKVPARWERVKRAVEIRNEQNSDTLILGNGDVLDLSDAKQKAEETGADGVMLGRAIFGNPWLFHPSKHLHERMTLSASSSASHRTTQYGSGADSSLSRPASHEGALSNIEIVTIEERLRVMVEHTKLFEELLPHKNFAIMKKHYKAYVNGFPGAAELRMELMEQDSAADIEAVVHHFLKNPSRE